jgi:hypothetical protein
MSTENAVDVQVYRSSQQYRDIAAKFDLSPEHPGLAVHPTMANTFWSRANQMGASAVPPMPGYRRGPRFFEKPMNEGCLEKGLACVKYTAYVCKPCSLP